MSNYKLIKDDEIPDGVVIPDESWAVQIGDCVVVYEYVKFGQHENPDGTFPVEFKYDIVEGSAPVHPEAFREFEKLLGDLAIQFIEDGAYASDMKEALKEAEEHRK